MTISQPPIGLRIGVLALQGAFSEHVQLLRRAATLLPTTLSHIHWSFIEVRTLPELQACDALILPGGESTTQSSIAEASGLLEPLREYVKVQRKPVWGTCAGLILLSESANRTKIGGQELIGGLDVRIVRNAHGRQIESFEAALDLPFLEDGRPFRGVFIRAPAVGKILAHRSGAQEEVAGEIVAPSKTPGDDTAARSRSAEVEVLGRCPERAEALRKRNVEVDDAVAVRQGNCFGTAFHPELAEDPRIHVWWLREVVGSIEARRLAETEGL